MQYPSYSFQQNSGTSEFFFESIGPKGVIRKVILFTPIEDEIIYNLALGDYDPLTDEVDDKSVSDNGDTAKILATIFQIAHHYLSTNPTHFVYFKGNTPARNRLYRMAINQAIDELSFYFFMFGLYHGSWEEFDPNRPYESFLIQRK